MTLVASYLSSILNHSCRSSIGGESFIVTHSWKVFRAKAVMVARDKTRLFFVKEEKQIHCLRHT